PAVLDPYNGRSDLARRQLRVLHPLSFVEDPTRILRGARLAGRLSFEFAGDTAAKARAVVEEGLGAGVSRSRLRAELELTFVGQGEEVAAAHVEAFNWPRRLLTARERVRRVRAEPDEATDADLEQLSPAEAALLRAAGGPVAERLVRLAEEPPRRRLRGRDVVALGLPEGPAVGRVLADVERARAQRLTSSFEDELELAKRLVDELRRRERPGVTE